MLPNRSAPPGARQIIVPPMIRCPHHCYLPRWRTLLQCPCLRIQQRDVRITFSLAIGSSCCRTDGPEVTSSSRCNKSLCVCTRPIIMYVEYSTVAMCSYVPLSYIQVQLKYTLNNIYHGAPEDNVASDVRSRTPFKNLIKSVPPVPRNKRGATAAVTSPAPVPILF